VYKANVNRGTTLELTLDKDGTGLLNGSEIKLDIKKGNGNHWHIIRDYKSYNIDVLEIFREEKKAKILVNGNTYEVALKDDTDLLLEKLGMDSASTKVVKELKAPMPGLVVEVQVEAGQEIAKGEPLLVLEAMKMENVLKAPTDVIIDAIKVSNGDTIEKNTTLITFK